MKIISSQSLSYTIPKLMKVFPPKLDFCDTTPVSKVRDRANSVKAVSSCAPGAGPGFGGAEAGGLRPLCVSVILEILKPKVRGQLNSKDTSSSV